ncbi:uncharacterized protein LOC123539409 isoform X3 [Mercenaria mercenaria]|uniref:uncharacterized protein LOC123539409 isoform X3 n=1 Tax=Mercenaria mercenaria TaxID=6596 RepID=UPI00234EDFD8|nr:uncharacterized protein LOC123539409 isoform X3 [Mercenaria mercenaria]
MEYIRSIVLIFLIVPFLSVIKVSNALHFTKTSRTFAKFPKWNACTNSSFSFDFKTGNSKALLMYTDDNGGYDYVELMVHGGAVRLRMNIVDGHEGSIEITLGRNVNDRRWHRVEVQRNRMETTLYLDEFHESRVAFGSDFYFGNVSRNNFVYFGGLPRSYRSTLSKLSLPSVYAEPRLEGDIRNVIYGNCSCRPVRGEMLEGESISRVPMEGCEVKNECGRCLCISGDDGPGCQCLGFSCPQDSSTYYHLPMDVINNDMIPNPSGLDAEVTGSPQLVNGVMYKALRINGARQKVKVSGPGHRNECFGDLSQCPDGYTIGLWLKFDRTGRGKGVYLSNGGHETSSHGVAMLYETGSIQWIFRKKSGQEWRATANNVLPRRWYHVAVTWSERKGLLIYINGNKAAQGSTPTMNPGKSTVSTFNDFIIGQSNDATGTRDLGVMTVDDFQFWSRRLSETVLREKGPIYQYHLTMDQLQDGQLITKTLEPRTIGRLRKVSGKIGKAVQLPGRGQYIDLGFFGDTCLGNTSLCMYGFTISLWIKFDRLESDRSTYYIASGGSGFSIFTYGNRIYANVQYGDRQYQASGSAVETGVWYFTEITWNPTTGLEIYIDQVLRVSQSASNHYQVTSSSNDNFYIGRANTKMYNERYAAAEFDDIRIYNADIDRLLAIDFIHREKPRKQYFGFDEMDGSRIKHPSIMIDTQGNAKLVPGKIGQALRLNGNQQKADFDNGDDCLGNIDYCRHGILMSFWFRPEQAKEGMYYLSTGKNGIDLSYMDGKYKIRISNSVYIWELMMSQLKENTWYFMEISWSEEVGLKLYVNNKLIEGDRYPTEVEWDGRTRVTDKFIIGQSNDAGSGSLYGAATFDEMEFWYASRDYLLSFGYIQRGKPTNYHIGMEAIKDGGKQIDFKSLPVMLKGYPLLVPGKFGNALKLSGNSQYIDFGERTDACLTNLDACDFGISIFFWVKIDSYDNNMYLLSTGEEGIKLYYNRGYIYITVDHGRKSWRMSVPEITENEWHFLELSWHPEFGLSFYIDNELQDLVSYRSIPEIRATGSEHFYIGAPNTEDVRGQRFSYADMAVDEVEIWYGRREELLAFDYIVRERGARLVPGKIGNGVSLQGNGDYVDFGQHMDKCFANIAECKHGLTISLWLYPRSLRTDQYFLSSPTYSLYFDNGELKSKFMSSDKAWTVSSGNINLNDWNNIMLSWDQEQGLKMYLNDRLMDRDREPADLMQSDEPQTGSLYIGKPSDDSIDGTANMMADEVQFWYANMERLRSQGINGGRIHEVVPLSQMPSSGILKLPTRTISLKGGASVVQGQHGRAIRLAGNGQYMEMGDNLTCGGNLDNCRQGFTMRFAAKPEKLLTNMYYLDSYPVSIFYRDGKLYATIRTSTKTWTVAAPGFKTGEWQVVDVSWHPEVGLTMYVNDEEVGAHKTHGTDIEPVYDYDRNTYFGKAMTDMRSERYADTTIENFEIWNVRRDVLTADGTSSGIGGDLNPGGKSTPKPALPTTQINTLQPPSADDSTTQVFVTSFPQNGNTQLVNIGTRLLKTTVNTTSSIIRFLGNSYIRYDLNVLTAEMLVPTDKESMSMQFITQAYDQEGLMWIFKGNNGQKMHIVFKDGYLIFTYDDSRGSPQQAILRHPDSRVLNDFRWHTVRIDKDGRNLKFYIDNAYASEMTTRSEVQFVSSGEVFLGGTQQTGVDTGGVTSSNFGGALTDVESTKVRGPSNELIISFLQAVEGADKSGTINIIPPWEWNNGSYQWGTTRPPPTTPPPARPTPVTFTSGSSMFYLRDPLDLRTGGSLSFRFRTLEPRGLLAIARGSIQSPTFFAMEIFDGLLYFVYDLGTLTSRKLFTDRRVDDGEWHEVMMKVQGNRITLSIDGRPFSVQVSQQNILKMFFYRLFVGGYDDFSKAPWPLYTRQGYRGCLESLKINDIGFDLHLFISNQNLRGVQRGCQSMNRYCQTQPCVSGFCRDRMDNYVCDCANTPYTGQNCNDDAVVAGWDGTLSTTFTFVNREMTHTNDISFRFLTPLSDTILFRTEADNKDDFIQAQLEDGKAKVTIKVDGQTRTFVTGNNLNDYFWHTLYIRRRADDVEVWVDDEPHMVGVIGGENYQLFIDEIKFGAVGSTGSLKANDYIGYMQNFIYDDQELFSQLKEQNSNSKWIINMPIDELPLLTYKPVTLTTSETYFQLPTLYESRTMKIMFKFKTRESNGLILYHTGEGNDVIAIELSNGQVRLAFNLGGRNMFTVVPTKMLNDNMWHTVIVSLRNGQFSVRADNENIDVTTSDGDRRLDLSGSLYIGGLPASMFSSPKVDNLIESKKGFRGCLASMDLNGAVPDLLRFANDRQSVLNGCTDLEMTCAPNACGTGVCMPGINDYWCNCNMTGYVGTPCTDWPIGYYFGKNSGKGIIIYEYPFAKQFDSDEDTLAFGFMTREENGVLYRIENSLDTKEFIEIRLENGFIVAESNTGSGLISISERARKFNDGEYHVVRYIRTGRNSSLQVNNLPMQTVAHSGAATLFNKVYRVMLGGKLGEGGVLSNNFYGIMGGAFYNGQRWFDMQHSGQLLHGKLVRIRGDVVLTRPFLLVAGGKPTTAAPPDIFIPVGEPLPSDIGGGGLVGPGIGGGSAGPGDVVGVGGPGGSLTPIGGVGIDVVGEPVPLASSLVGPAPPAMAGGARAGAVVGTVLGTLAFMTSLMWALYKLKPGVPTIMSPGAGSAGGGTGMSISAPRATSNLGAVQAASAGGGGAGGAGAGATKVTVVNGSAAGAGGGGGGGGSSTYTSYFQSTSTSVGGAGGGAGGGGSAVAGGHADAIDSSTLRATGTFSNKGTAIGSPTAKRAHLGSSSTGYSAGYQSNTMQSYGSSAGGTMDRAYDSRFMSSTSGGDAIPDYDLPVPGTLQSGYSSSTLNTHYNYQVKGSANSRSGFVASNQVQPSTHTSVLSIIISGGKGSSTPPRSDIYSAALAPARDQGFVDRSEDMIIEQAPPVMFVRPMIVVGDMSRGDVNHQSNLTVHTSSLSRDNVNQQSNLIVVPGNIPTVRYTADVESISFSSANSNKRHSEGKVKDGVFSSLRKSSLQTTSNSGKNDFGYNRLESYSSETNIDGTLTRNLGGRKTGKNGSKSAHSRDDLYESTITVTSTLDSVDNSLFSLTEESTQGACAQEALSASNDSLGLFNVSSGTPEGHIYLEFQNEQPAPSSDVVYAKVNKTQKQKQKKITSKSVDINVRESEDGFEMVDAKYTVTCTAELKDGNHSDDTMKETILDMSESAMSFDDTIKAFENLADVDIEPEPKSAEFTESQTERAENVIEYQPAQLTRKKKDSKTDRSETSVDISNNLFTGTGSSGQKVNTWTSSVTNTQVTQSTSVTNMTFTTSSSVSNDSTTVGTMLNKGLLEDELDRSVNALLVGIDVDTAEWTAIKDKTVSSDSDNDTYEVQNLKTVTVNKQGQYVMSSAMGAGAVTPGAAADEVRVDCCLMTGNGASVVTGSSLGPPQVWDMQTGELQNIMKGDTVGSTNLHLVCGDRLLVGAVHADMEINEYSSRKGVFNHTLQIWDFQTGRPLSMAEGEYCSTLCPMSDSDKVLFGRTDKFGDATSIIAWDLMGNQMIKEMRYDAPVGNNDYISYLNKSKNDRYIVAGFTNSFDNNAEFMTFDMTLTSYNISEPAMLKLDANPDCTAILPKDEAVTGLRNGDLVIWNIRTAQPSRQLLGSGGAHAHSREVKSVTLSEDSRYLVSSSADGTLKVWDMHTERPIHTLQGHTDEVWCSAISNDNEIVVSGSADGTIRLWRMKNGTEMCTFNCGVDIFYVTMSRDKGTIVALGDKYGARKLIMLQVVRTKIKKIVSS